MAEMSREEQFMKSCKPYQEIIEKVTVDECLCVLSGFPINCNREEMILRAIGQKIYKLEKIENIMNDCFCSQGICLRRCKYIDIADIDNCVAVRRYDEIGKILRGD